MSSVRPNGPRSMYDQGDYPREVFSRPPAPRASGGPPWGLIVTGLVVVGLGIMAWNAFGPDLRRYMKMSSM